MRDVDVSIIENKLREACMAIAVEYSHDIICALRKGEQEETRDREAGNDERGRYCLKANDM